MYNKNDKRRLYWLMKSYLSDDINEIIFCDEFYYSYNLEIDFNTLTNIERDIFNELNNIVSRYSNFPEDLNLDPYAFSDKKELYKKVEEVYGKMKNNFEQQS